ncbi:MAG TPA: hypothetical protein VFA32_09000 [Dehalococcoidia bacterium]|nr:hypothetical protein [Dehalococcoidia bacterium]
MVAPSYYMATEVGRLIDEDTRTFLRRHLDSFAQWIQRVGTPGEALVAQR